MQNATWSRMVLQDRMYFSYFRKGVTTHCTVDNNDGHQETLTGSGTTQDTNKKIFQVLSTGERQNLPVVGKQERPVLLKDESNIWSTASMSYNIGKHNAPDLFLKFQMQFDFDQIEQALKRDIACSLCDDDFPLLGSWRFFNKLVSNIEYESIVPEYLRVNPHPTDCPIFKGYLDFLLKVFDELEISFIYVYSDEMVYLKLCEISWKNKDIFTKNIILMGGFHQ